jgi:hypothetical protein
MESYSFGECPICRQGRLLAVKSPATGQLLLMCDDCESQWNSPDDAKSFESAITSEAAAVVSATMQEVEAAGWAVLSSGVVEVR